MSVCLSICLLPSLAQRINWQGHAMANTVWFESREGVEVRPVEQPHAIPTRVGLNRVCRCPAEMPDVFWPGKNTLALSPDTTINP